MPFSLLEAEIFVTLPVEIDYRDGVFHVVDRYSESCVVRRAIPPHIYMANLKRANAALAKWCSEQRREGVVPFALPGRVAAG